MKRCFLRGSYPYLNFPIPEENLPLSEGGTCSEDRLILNALALLVEEGTQQSPKLQYSFIEWTCKLMEST